jgi:hypothetical protein
VLVASAICSGLSFIVSRTQDKINLKQKYTQHNLTIKQYSDLNREICSVLSKNHLTNEEYQAYIDEIYDKISLIEDTSLII